MNKKNISTITATIITAAIMAASLISPGESVGKYTITPVTSLSSDFTIELDEGVKDQVQLYQLNLADGTVIGSNKIDGAVRTIPLILNQEGLEVKLLSQQPPQQHPDGYLTIEHQEFLTATLKNGKLIKK